VINKVKFNPDLTKLVGVEKSLIGEHDFENFRKLGSNERSTIRTIIDFNISQVFLSDIYNVSEKYTVYCIKIVGNSFLYSMVRNLVGALFEVFKDHVSLDDFVAMVNKTGRYNYTMAPAKGLCLVKVNY
jgi:tRNA pseudouridine38-40 synthase